MHKDGKFTVGKGNKSINYLTLTVYSPNCIDTIILKDSFHHLKNRMAAMENYCRRATTILKYDEERKKEIQVGKQIATVNDTSAARRGGQSNRENDGKEG